MISFLSDYVINNSYNKAEYEHIAIVNYSGITNDYISKTAQLLVDIYTS